ncbi:hypothetical protein SAMN06265174_102423 [Dietzia kunjamensis subsp. schimae]|jgi:hypothetical protein|uniref:Uncharacterized protein n=1 Tax=Dietzia kunjamensis subsp. schimae TaxID=498198 RepID=A0ABY1MZ80_9ACTN|nr:MULTISPECIES: hypothetical protein [unclassified Dietzia]MCY1659107.1 hypothetical protein [Dietzia sp. SL131]MDV3356671.1 hypothetical protein [Dietzia sp. IN118]SMO57591.1 hypothetical protein SAMN06265174_102423 [Dietzia kunjamensis subsp. schimae]
MRPVPESSMREDAVRRRWPATRHHRAESAAAHREHGVHGAFCHPAR